MFLLVALFGLPFLLYIGISFAKNILSARKTGLPYTFSPWHELEVWAYFSDPFLRWKCSTYLMRGQGWPRWARFLVKDWSYEDKGRAHQEYGDVFLVVSPGGIVCYVANAKTAMAVCSRRKDFVKPPEKMKMLEPFGPNVVSTDGDLWRFHLRITLPPLGEAVNKLVWSEAMRQSDMLADSWASVGSGDLKNDVYSLTTNVMSSAGFGRQANWTESANVVPSGHTMTLTRSIVTVVTHLPHVLLCPQWLLARSPWRIVYDAYQDLDKYMHEFLAVEKTKLSRNLENDDPLQANLLTAILRSSSEFSKDVGKHGAIGGRSAFTDDEILGNVFMFLMAGYDTTANVIIYSALSLAMNSVIQDRMIEEVDRIYDEAAKAGRTELSYAEDMPKFRYVLAFMYEIMRVFPTVLTVTRLTAQSQEIMVEAPSKNSYGSDTRSYTLPAGCNVYNNVTATHYNENYWPHAHIIEPRRWLSDSPNSFDPTAISEKLDSDLRHPFPNHTKGTFLTFSEGPRACLGRRFAQVEFVAFFARVLRQYRVQLKEDNAGESIDRILRLRSGGSPITLVPPEDVKILLKPRAEAGK